MDEIYSDTEVLSLSGGEALEWFLAVSAKRRPTPVDFDWLGLAKGAALRARIADRDQSLAWAELCAAVYQQLGSVEPNASHDIGEMYCRVAMIELHGEQSGDDLRDPETVYCWFRETLPKSYEETLQLRERLMDEITDDYVNDVVKPLQAVKKRLTIIRAMPDNCILPPDLDEFSQLYHSLP